MYANEFQVKDGKFRLHCIGHYPTKGEGKTDAFLFEYDAKYTLVDGGITNNTSSLDYLLDIRRSLLADHKELIDDPACKLRIDWFISHFHVDHVGATLENVIPNEFIEIGTVYYPPDSTLPQSYNHGGFDGDTKYRPLITKALAEYQPNHKIINISFGKENVLRADNGKLKQWILPSDTDYGDADHIQKFVDMYYEGEHTDPKIPVNVVNACVMWTYLKFGRHTFLLTGDTQKKLEGYEGNEAFDDMVDTYKELFGEKITVVKYPHHGKNRDSAAGAVLALKPGWIVLSSEKATAGEIIRTQYPRSRARICNCGNVTYVFETDGKSRMKVTTRSYGEYTG